MRLIPASPEALLARAIERAHAEALAENAARATHKMPPAPVRWSDRDGTAALRKAFVGKESGINLRLERIIRRAGGARATWAYRPTRKDR